VRDKRRRIALANREDAKDAKKIAPGKLRFPVALARFK